MSTSADREVPRELSTWPVERLQAFAMDAQSWGDLESVRLVAQQHAYDSDQPSGTRRRWAELSLLANQRMHSDGPRCSAREIQQELMLRMWVIDHLGPEEEDPNWSPDRLASDTLDALALTPSEAEALASNWRELPIEQIRELRQHKNLTLHLDSLIRYLRPSSQRDQLLLWTETRILLP